MATTTKQVPAGINPITNGINSLSDSMALAKSMKDAIVSFASGDTFGILSQLIDSVPLLEKEIRRKDERIQTLAVQLNSEKDIYSANEQKQLKVYSCAYDTWKDEKATLQSRVKELETNLQERDTAVTTIQKDLEEIKTKGRELEAKYKAKLAILKGKDQDISKLQQQLQQSQKNESDYSGRLSKSQSRVTLLEAEAQNNRAEYEKLMEDYTVAKNRWKEVVAFSAPLKEVNIEDMANKLEGLWTSATNLVRRSFGQDLPDGMLETDWNKLRDTAIFKHQIPLPQSNSDIAKEMRIVTVLGILARLIDKFIFQPTYLLTAESGFRELLSREASIDQRKERFSRGTLLSMFPERQKSEGKARIGLVIDELFADADVDGFLAPELNALFEEELEQFLEQLQETWGVVQHSQQKMEPTFRYNPDLHWESFKVQVRGDKKGKDPDSPVTVDSLEDDVSVIFPRFYLIGSETKPITAGTVLQKAQFREATQELRKRTLNTPFEQQALVRQRTRPSRSMSISGDGARGGPAKNRFLSKPVAAPYV